MRPHSIDALAFSYQRFSRPEQARGDSLRRQDESREGWLKRHPEARLDTTTTLRDLGRSAYTGKHRENPDRHALAAFLKMVESGKVPRGSYLLLESLDRLTREHIQPALLLVLGLLQAGVRIVQLSPVEVTYDDRSDAGQVMMMIMELSRGHSESRMKSERLGAVWGAKKDCARNGVPQPPRRKDGQVTAALTGRLPAWVQEKGGKLKLVPERAEVIRRIFRLAAHGYGAAAIIKKLTADGVPTMGSSGVWGRAYVGLILRDRRALGEYQPMRGKEPDGGPIRGYYPVAVTEDEWLAARAGAAERRNHGGPSTGKGRVNIFAGLLRHARDGDLYQMTQRRSCSRGRPPRQFTVLINAKGAEGLVRSYSVPYEGFERAVLQRLAELDANEILDGDGPPDEVAALTAALKGADVELTAATAFMDAHGFSPTIGRRVAELEARKRDLSAKLADARARAAHPADASWGECQDLAAVLDGSPDPTDTRLRLRSALRRVVEDIRLLVVRRGLDTLIVVQLWFVGGKRQRSYLILHRPASGRRPEEWWPPASVAGEADLDLRKREDAATLVKALESVDLAAITAAQEEPAPKPKRAARPRSA